ncbi:HNH endonuclease [Planctomycetales bacterium ZRK34]|nr:HNH endonuclease [Planctomycetales bacterium ZRK34]
MAKLTVNLDAMIARDDFEVKIEDDSQSTGRDSGNFKLSELEQGQIVLNMLRKPEFQRETKDWTPERVAELIRSFVDGDLIPSVIVWHSQLSGDIFVVDGSHRLSALIAWTHDDYGDRQLSSTYFSAGLSKDELSAAKKTRELIAKTVGSYADLKSLGDRATPIQRRRANTFGMRQIEAQWIRGDASKAERSFFTINQSAVAIHPVELRIIKARKKPNAIAARGIIRSGTGHKYWSAFNADVQNEIEKLSKDIYGVLFEPFLETPIKTLELPVAGRGQSADGLSLVVEFINVANKLKTEMWLEDAQKKAGRKKSSDERDILPDDLDGAKTIEYLRSVKRIATRVSGNASRSLGLHPAVYFYSATGRYQPATFLAIVSLFQELELNDGFHAFTEVRYRLEEFLVKYRYFINQIVRNYGAGTRGLEPLVTMYKTVIQSIRDDASDEKIAVILQQNERLKFLKVMDDESIANSKEFTSSAKSAAFFHKALEEGAVRCEICNARIHMKGINIDHSVPLRDGGSGHSKNAQVTHPFCQSGYKERRSHAAASESS